MKSPRTDATLSTMPACLRRQQRGVTLVESLTVLTVIAVALGAAAPSFEQARQRRHLEGAAAQLETDIQHARSAAVASDRSVRLTVTSSSAAGGTCYVVHTGTGSDCPCVGNAGPAVCRAGEQSLRTVRFAPGGPVQLDSNVASILFDSAKGTSTPTGTLKLSTHDGSTVHLVVNVMGRVRMCSPNGPASGYKRC